MFTIIAVKTATCTLGRDDAVNIAGEMTFLLECTINNYPFQAYLKFNEDFITLCLQSKGKENWLPKVLSWIAEELRLGEIGLNSLIDSAKDFIETAGVRPVKAEVTVELDSETGKP